MIIDDEEGIFLFLPRTGKKVDKSVASFEPIFCQPVCTTCGAYKWPNESKEFCCSNGKVKNDIPEPPQELQEIYGSRDFVSNIRSYNNSLALASIGCNEVQCRGFSPVVKIYGKVYHCIGSLIPTAGSKPHFSQLYFYDTENELQNRLNVSQNVIPEILEKLQNILHGYNPFVCTIRKAVDLSPSNTDCTITLSASDRRKQFSLPTTDQIAAIVPEMPGEHLQVLFQTQEGELKCVNELSGLYDPLHYVLLLPYGTEGYKASKGVKNDVTMLQYYRCRLQIRNVHSHFNAFFKSGRLIQQYAVDQFAKIENARFNFYRKSASQKKFRAARYAAIVDAIENGADNENIGRKIYLPATHYGSPGWYAAVFQDFMSIIRQYGRPDLFITFTTNPAWKEITGSLFPGQCASDRPDITSRVFHGKLNLLLRLVTVEQILGRVVAYACMKEDQKRGLPVCY